MVRTTDIDVSRLYVTAVDVQPIERDWSEGYDPDGNGWTFYESVRVEEGPHAGLETDGMGELRDDDGGWIDMDDDTRQEIDDRRQGPMMNYAYPLPHYSGDPDRDARSIVDLPLCLIEAEGTTYLALTGGGMDLSWEICEAYMRLGYLPPAHFADLPGMAGKPANDDDRTVMAACRRTAEVLHARADQIVANLDRMDIRSGS